MEYVSETVNTVLGPKKVFCLGRILTHEHLTINFKRFYIPLEHFMSNYLYTSCINLENVGIVKQYPYSNIFNLTLNDTQGKYAVEADLNELCAETKTTIVENSSIGLHRDLVNLEYFSEKCGVNIIVGTGYYVESAQDASVLAMTQEEMYNMMYNELENGCHEYTKVKAGFIGEVGSDWPIKDFERRSICATGELQEQLRCAVSFHPGRHQNAPEEILRLYEEAGGKRSRAVMSHLDRTFPDVWDLMAFVRDGKCYFQFDLFGIECSLYQLNEEISMPSDAQRIKFIQEIKEEDPDLMEKILMSHDIHTKHRLRMFGGHGYSHIYNNVIPLMRKRKFTEKEIKLITIENPRTWLTRH